MATVDPPFSVITVYNDPDELESMLLSSLEQQQAHWYETVLIDNQDQTYECAAATLNAGAAEASGEYYLFLHQDVFLKGDDWFASLDEELDKVPDLGAGGIIGMEATNQRLADQCRNSIEHGADRHKWGHDIEEPTPIQTMDELGIIVPADVFADYKFDSDLCDGWHLYGVEYALRIGTRTDRDVYALPLDVWHGSTGLLRGSDYFRVLSSIIEQYPCVDMIHTTCGTWLAHPSYTRFLQELAHLTENTRFEEYAQMGVKLTFGDLFPSTYNRLHQVLSGVNLDL